MMRTSHEDDRLNGKQSVQTTYLEQKKNQSSAFQSHLWTLRTLWASHIWGNPFHSLRSVAFNQTMWRIRNYSMIDPTKPFLQKLLLAGPYMLRCTAVWPKWLPCICNQEFKTQLEDACLYLWYCNECLFFPRGIVVMLTTAVMLNLFYVQKFLPLRGIFWYWCFMGLEDHFTGSWRDLRVADSFTNLSLDVYHIP